MLVDNYGDVEYIGMLAYMKRERQKSYPSLWEKSIFENIKGAGSLKSFVRDVYLCIYIDNTYISIYVYVYEIMYNQNVVLQKPFHYSMTIINYRISKNVIKRTANKITRLSYTAKVPPHFLKVQNTIKY